MAAAKAANPTAQEFSGMDYQQSARITRTLGQMSVVVQPTTNPRYEVAPCCTGETAAICALPSFVGGYTISSLYTPPSPFNSTYDLAFDITFDQPFLNVTSTLTELTYEDVYGNTVPVPDSISGWSIPLTQFTVYTHSSYTNITAIIQLVNECGTVYRIFSNINAP